MLCLFYVNVLMILISKVNLSNILLIYTFWSEWTLENKYYLLLNTYLK